MNTMRELSTRETRQQALNAALALVPTHPGWSADDLVNAARALEDYLCNKQVAA